MEVEESRHDQDLGSKILDPASGIHDAGLRIQFHGPGAVFRTLIQALGSHSGEWCKPAQAHNSKE